MQIQKFRYISVTCSLILGVLIAEPASSAGPKDAKCDRLAEFEKKICEIPPDTTKCDWLAELEKKICESPPDTTKCLSTASLERDLLLKGDLSEGDWKSWGDIETCAAKRKADLAGGKYKHHQGGWRRIPAFLFRGMNLTGKIEETNGSNSGKDTEGVPIDFGTSKSLREVTFGWSKKKILQDLVVALSGPGELAELSKKTAHFKPLSLGNLLLDRVTVDATISHGRTVDFDSSTITDLDDLKTSTTWTVKVEYTMPIDKLFGFDYKNK